MFGLLLAAHLLCDFPLQPDWMAQEKTKDNEVLVAHVGVHALVTGIFLAMFVEGGVPVSWNLTAAMAWIAGTHLIIDHRRWFEPKESWGDNAQMWVWLNDQILHITALSVAPFVGSFF